MFCWIIVEETRINKFHVLLKCLMRGIIHMTKMRALDKYPRAVKQLSPGVDFLD